MGAGKTAVGRRVADELDSNLGERVGYRVRFQEKVSRETELKFMTDGILLAETRCDPLLERYHSVIIDEASTSRTRCSSAYPTSTRAFSAPTSTRSSMP